MNATVTDYSAEPTRRVDLSFACAKGEEPAKIQALMQEVMAADPRVKKDPAPFARLSGELREGTAITVDAENGELVCRY